MSSLHPLDISSVVASFHGPEVVVDNPLIAEKLARVDERYRDEINTMEQVLQELEVVPKSLLTVYAGTQGSKAGVIVLHLISTFLRKMLVMKMSCRELMMSSTKAIEFFSYALLLINKEDESERNVEGGLEMLSEVEKIANSIREKAVSMNRVVAGSLCHQIHSTLPIVFALEHCESIRRETLDLTLKILGKIVLVIEHVQTYWANIECECQILTQQPQGVIKRKLKLLNNWIERGWYVWFAFAKMNHSAMHGLGAVVEKAKEVLDDLPTSENAKARFQELAVDVNELLNKALKAQN